ncbi:hypothetical protein NMY22_g3962 [Coprinellus aureogranulatus]|nr:hypothetical protein NMY22_g3962 [Coprinellus aureogranulatus]
MLSASPDRRRLTWAASGSCYRTTPGDSLVSTATLIATLSPHLVILLVIKTPNGFSPTSLDMFSDRARKGTTWSNFTLDGETLYVEQELAEALGWRGGGPTEGVTLRLSGWSPHYFAITQKGTDADHLAHGTIESSRNPHVVATLELLKKSDSE